MVLVVPLRNGMEPYGTGYATLHGRLLLLFATLPVAERPLIRLFARRDAVDTDDTPLLGGCDRLYGRLVLVMRRLDGDLILLLVLRDAWRRGPRFGTWCTAHIQYFFASTVCPGSLQYRLNLGLDRLERHKEAN